MTTQESRKARALEALKDWKAWKDEDFMAFLQAHYYTVEEALTIPREQQEEWQAIDTAPRDGTYVLLAVPTEQMDYKAGKLMVVKGSYQPQYSLEAHDSIDPEDFPDQFDYHENSGQYYSKPDFFVSGFENTYGDEILRKVTPTHWMPLPLPPPPKTDGGG